MSRERLPLDTFRIVELFIATLLGGLAGKLFDIYWRLPDLLSQIIGAVIVVFSLLGFASFFYFVIWFVPHFRHKSEPSKKQDEMSKRTEDVCYSLQLRAEFKNRKLSSTSFNQYVRGQISLSEGKVLSSLSRRVGSFLEFIKRRVH